MNKRIIGIICLAAGLAAVVGIIIVAANIAFIYLIAHPFHAQRITTVLEGRAQSTGHSVPLPRKNLPPVIIDSQGYGTENNWLAHHIALRIATVAYFVRHPNSTMLPDFKIKAQVDADTHTVQLEIGNFSTSPVTATLKPDFAWDPDGYAPLAAQLLGGDLPPPQATEDDSYDLLTALQTLTGPELAKADMRLSAQMQQEPASAKIHEQAALILVGLALRDCAGDYTDYRQILCRATAHLALARALRRGDARSWEGEIADAGIRTLSGRETDALSHLDALDARADAPAPAKMWLATLRLRAKDDWRTVPVEAGSPLLLKIVWAHVLSHNLTDLGVTHRLEAMANLEIVPDWGRCALTNGYHFSVETGNTYAQQTALLEFAELNQVLQLEQAPQIDPTNPNGSFSQPLQEKVFYGQPASLHIIGPDMFVDVTRRHLLYEIEATSFWLTKLLGVTDEAKSYTQTTRQAFAGTRLLETVHFATEPMNYTEALTRLDKENIRWEPWEMATSKLPDCLDFIYPDFHTLHAFYADGLPFGTAYDLDNRALFSLNNAQLLADDAHPEVYHNPNPDVAHPDGDSLRKLAPGSFAALLIGTKIPDAIQRSKPWWDFNLYSIMWIENATSGFISEADHEVLVQKHLALEPDYYFTWGAELRRRGRADEAAAADRKGFDQAFDRVWMSDSVGPLVDYDYDHGLKDEALTVASRAADVGSQRGIGTYERLLQKVGRLDEAEHLAQAIKDSYDDPSLLDALYAAHPEHFGEKSSQAQREAFPHGMTKVDLHDFQAPPTSGCVYTTDSDLLEQGGLKPGDVVVAFDSYKVESEVQYNYIRGLSTDPHMHLIIWRKGHYLQISTSAPNRMFLVTLDDYPPKPEQ